MRAGSTSSCTHAHSPHTQGPRPVQILLDASHMPLESATSATAPSSLLANLEAEASLMASLRHPNIVAFMGVCQFPPAIVTEFCSRGSLTAVLRSGKGSAAAAAELTWPRRITMVGLLGDGEVRGDVELSFRQATLLS
jgi:serine/threonine protein kinase